MDLVAFAGWRGCIRLTDGGIELIVSPPRAAVHFGEVHGRRLVMGAGRPISAIGDDEQVPDRRA
jgi:hypothetical protein